ncbi:MULTISPECIES: lasso peptide klebsidin [Enterobacteriaceae]|nr:MULTISPECIES: lasso peptide klebsidin [Enterobacteriaceae]MBO3723108.1 lasso peptide klebsidin [Klebsiella pneumoniae]MCB4496179.1 lasso peptide klebsidin [Escherichia coli]MCS4330036.1 lasso peptide klebsidin [Klebsiella pneumoniae]PLK31260.1 acinetodin/klebsidin/J25 family lasso peptide [Klebsiella variicola]REI39436.1 lasso peptide klebsidin [Klebsiella variicola]
MMQQKKNDQKKVNLKKLNKKASKVTRGSDGPIIEFFNPNGVMHYG